jgi:uncharacterized protein YfaS (alpha-2-macroglobulin family)
VDVPSETETVKEAGLAVYVKSVTADVELTLQQNESASISLYNLDGQLLKTIPEKQFAAGTYHFKIPMNQYSSGTYLVELNTGHERRVTKFVLVH